MNPLRLLQIVLARWKIVLAIFIVGASAGVYTAYHAPKYYISTATVVVDAKADPVAGLSQITTPNFLATQVDIIKSSRVGNRVIKLLKLDQNPTMRKQYADSKAKSSFDEWLSNLLQKGIVAEPGRGSNVIRISYTAADPQFAAVMANTFVKAYLDIVLEMRVEPAKRYSEFFDERSKGMRDSVEKAQAKLSAYQKEKGIIGADEKSDIESAKLNELSAQLLQVQAAAVDSSSRQNQAQLLADRTQEVLASGIISSYKTELSRLEVKLQELSAKFGDAHPQVVEIKITIAETKSKLDTEMKRVVGGVSVTNSINRQKEAEIKLALEAQRTKILKLKEVRDELTVMQRDLDIAQKAYDNVQNRFNQSSLESQNQQTSISILSQAEASNESTSQMFAKNAAKAMAAAAAAGLLLAFAIEYFDKRIRIADDVLFATDLPIIGVMPKPDSTGIFGKSKPSLLQKRILRQLPRPS
jgi:polysaccharide biosynthesis transport protein